MMPPVAATNVSHLGQSIADRAALSGPVANMVLKFAYLGGFLGGIDLGVNLFCCRVESS